MNYKGAFEGCLHLSSLVVFFKDLIVEIDGQSKQCLLDICYCWGSFLMNHLSALCVLIKIECHNKD